MGRRIPLGDDPLIHPALSFSLFAAGMAAVIAIVSGLCSFRRKPPQPEETQNQSSPPEAATETADLATPSPPIPPATTDPEANEGGSDGSEDNLNTEDNNQNRGLPLPPARKALHETYSCNNMVMKSASTRKLNSSLTVRIPRTMSVSKKGEEREDKPIKKKKLKAENSILVRPIILGEKCRVPDDDDEEEDGVLYAGKGKRVTAYHPRSTSMVSLSRTTLKIDHNSIPVKEKEKDGTREDEEEKS